MVTYEIQPWYVIRDKIQSKTKFSLRKDLRIFFQQFFFPIISFFFFLKKLFFLTIFVRKKNIFEKKFFLLETNFVENRFSLKKNCQKNILLEKKLSDFFLD